MKVQLLRVLTFLLCFAGLTPVAGFGQVAKQIAVGGKISTLGFGIEGAANVTKKSNVRVAGNFLGYDRNFDKDGIHYAASLRLRSFQITYDQYLFSGFHVSPGILAYNGNRVDAAAAVPAGQTFTLGNTTYFSGATNPLAGSAKLKLGKAAPMIMIGVGNPLPRSGRHLGFNFEAGLVFQGSPTATLGLTGSACTVNATTGCVNATTDPTVQSNIVSEQNKINNDLDPLKYYPVVSLGITWRVR